MRPTPKNTGTAEAAPALGAAAFVWRPGQVDPGLLTLRAVESARPRERGDRRRQPRVELI